MQVALGDFERHMVPRGDGPVAAVAYGADRSRVLFLHGNSSHHRIFIHQLEALALANLSVLAADLPGHGQSGDAQSPDRTYSFPGYACAVTDLLDSLRVEAVHVIGWSLGGHVALELMGRDQRVKSAMILGAPPIKPGPTVLDDAFLTSEGMSLAGKEHFTEDDARLYGSLMLGGEELLTAELLAAVRRTDGRARKHMVANGVGGIGLDQRCLAERDLRPIAVVHGRKDPFVSLSYLQGIRFRSAWRNGVQVLDGVGHAPHWQSPAAFNALLLQWLDHVRDQCHSDLA